MRKFVALVFLIIIAGLAWLGVSVRHRIAEKEARQKAAAEKKFEEVKVTLIEGWGNAEIFAALEKAGFGSVADFEKAEKELDRSKYGFLDTIPPKVDLEGYFFPDTYRIAKNATPSDVLDMLLENFKTRFAKVQAGANYTDGYYIIPGFETLHLKNRVAPGLTLHEVVTLAAIVEKETGKRGEAATSDRLLEERKTVAGIFLNRLTIGQALQSDATVNYITKSGRSSSTLADTEIDSPYNTYKYAGLPPGPIGSPSSASLSAVLSPIKTDYFYFLHSATGEIYYAKTFEQHVNNRNKYLK